MSRKRDKAKLPTDEDRYAGERIREARIKLGLTQVQLAELIGTSYQQLQKYENGTNRVNGARINRLLSALNRPFNYLFPNVTDIRANSDPVLSAMLASKDGQEAMHDYSRLSAEDRRLIRTHIKRLLEKEQTHD